MLFITFISSKIQNKKSFVKYSRRKGTKADRMPDQIPEQVKVAAVGNNRMSAIYTPHLTSVNLSHRTGGLEAGAILMDMIQNGNDAIRMAQMQCRLYERESTGANA